MFVKRDKYKVVRVWEDTGPNSGHWLYLVSHKCWFCAWYKKMHRAVDIVELTLILEDDWDEAGKLI